MRNILETAALRNSKKLTAVIILLCFSFSTYACEICGCSINGYSFGILPQSLKNHIGIRYTYRDFQSQHLISEREFILGSTSTEYYNSAELWGRFYVSKKFQLMVFVPFNHFATNEEGAKTKAAGMGDITIVGNYTVLNTAATGTTNFKQSLLVGGGIKLPTGKFDVSKSSQELNPSINAGTGSVDFLTDVIYNCRYKKVGLNLDANYRINTVNRDDFRYGNRFTTAAKFFYWKDIGKKTTLLPNAGFSFENAAKDKHGDEVQNISGGNITYFSAGLEIYAGRIVLGGTFNHPLSQNMFKGLVQTGNNFSVNASIMF